MQSKLTVDGVAALLNGEFDRADAILSEHSADLVAQTSRALVATLRALICERPPLVADALARLDTVGNAVTHVRTQHAGAGGGGLLSWVFGSKPSAPPDAAALELSALSAEIHACQCLVQFRTAAYVRGAYVLRQSWSEFAALDADCEQLQGAGRSIYLFGAGLFRFFVSLVPASFAWAVKLAGFSADRDAGLALLHRCYEENGIRSGGALLVLVWIELFFLERLDKAADLMRVAAERYPRGPLFKYLEGYLHRKRGMLDAATAAFAACYDFAADVRELQLACVYEQGWCRFLALDDAAVELLERFLAEHKSTSFRAFASWQLGTALLLRNEPDRAMEVFKRTPELVRPHFSFDAFAARKALEYLTGAEFGVKERALTVAQIHVDAMRFGDAIDELGKLTPTLFHAPKGGDALLGAARAGCAEQACLAAWLLGCAHRGKRNVAAARQCFQAAVELDKAVHRERYAVAHALTELGELAVADGDGAAARGFFARVSAMGEFDFDKPLLRRISQSLDVLAAREQNRQSFVPRAPHVPGAFYLDSSEFKELVALDELCDKARQRLAKASFSRAAFRQLLGEVLTGASADDVATCEARLVALGFVAVRDEELLQWPDAAPDVLNRAIEWPLPVRKSADVVDDWESAAFAILQFREHGGKLVDLDALHGSEELRRFRVASLELQTVELASIDALDRKCLFINCYNAMVLDALVRRHKDSKLGVIERKRFFSKIALAFAGVTLTLDEIEHGLLRANRPAPTAFDAILQSRPPFDAADRRLRLAPPFDPRIHFALNCGALSCPALELYDHASCDKLLQIAAESFLDETIVVHANGTVECSQILSWYGADFGDSPDAIVRRLVQLAPNAACVAKLNEVLGAGAPKLKFSSYSWDLYCKRPTKQPTAED